jgi:hypothetical protein
MVERDSIGGCDTPAEDLGTVDSREGGDGEAGASAPVGIPKEDPSGLFSKP